MGLSYGATSNIFYVVLAGTVVLTSIYMAAGASAIALLLSR